MQPVWIGYHFDKGWKSVGGIYPRLCPKWPCWLALIASLILARKLLLRWSVGSVESPPQGPKRGVLGRQRKAHPLHPSYHTLKVTNPGQSLALGVQKWVSYQTPTWYTPSPLSNFLGTDFASEWFKKAQFPIWWRISTKVMQPFTFRWCEEAWSGA